MREKSQVLSEFWIKILAILTMTLDHIGAFIVDSDWTVNFPTNGVPYGVGYVFRCVGRLSFPLFAFMLAEGMRKSHDRVEISLQKNRPSFWLFSWRPRREPFLLLLKPKK